jgi:CDP-diacylglycerol---glycerol-3-phosphate 3-phosphatidyltransferase
MANLITLFRLLLIFVIVALALYATPTWQLINLPLIIVIISLDGVDGIIARMRKETSLFGAVFDITADRIIEMVLWILFAKLNLISVWVAIIFVVRGILVDSIRNKYTETGSAPFSIMQTALGKFLVASKTMRFLYGFMKLVTFAWLLFLPPLSALWHDLWLSSYQINFISDILVYFTLALCLLRGIPVIWEVFLGKFVSL